MKIIIALAIVAVSAIAFVQAGPITNDETLASAKAAKHSALNFFQKAVNKATPSDPEYTSGSESDSSSTPSSPKYKKHSLRRKLFGLGGGVATRFEKHREHFFVPQAPTTEHYEPEKYPTGNESPEQAADRYRPRPQLQYSELN